MRYLKTRSLSVEKGSDSSLCFQIYRYFIVGWNIIGAFKNPKYFGAIKKRIEELIPKIKQWSNREKFDNDIERLEK